MFIADVTVTDTTGDFFRGVESRAEQMSTTGKVIFHNYFTHLSVCQSANNCAALPTASAGLSKHFRESASELVATLLHKFHASVSRV